MNIKLVFGFLISCMSFINLNAQGLLPEKWKFKTGDNVEWAKPSFNDNDWKEIAAGSAWENQSYDGYDGYAWYRTSVFISSKLKEDAKKYGGLILRLGRIDDADITYLNGELLGKTGGFPPYFASAHSTLREYPISVDKVLWNQPNVIAVRVYDGGGQGGMCTKPVELTVKSIADNFTIAPAFKEQNHVLLGASDIIIPLSIKNNLATTFKGKVTINVISDFKEPISTQIIETEIGKKAEKKISFPIKNLKPGFYKVTVRFEGKLLSKESDFSFAYEPEKVVSAVDAQPDFLNYWERAKKELKAVEPQYKVIKKDSLCTKGHTIFLVEMRSLGNTLVRGWLSIPTKAGKYPAILRVQGYSSTTTAQDLNYGDDFVSFGLNIRGHGNSKDDVNPGFPGYLQNFVKDKELYIYRGAYMDCVRAIDFLCSRAEVDTSRIVVEGGSQGGALTFATAALDNKRIKFCVPQIPFLSDFLYYFKVAIWPGNEFVNLVEKDKKATWENVFYTLSYIDIKNLAPMIKAPMPMCSGLLDDVCPPHINFAAYNNVKSKKEYVVFPNLGHAVSDDFNQFKMDWIRKNLGMK